MCEKQGLRNHVSIEALEQDGSAEISMSATVFTARQGGASVGEQEELQWHPHIVQPLVVAQTDLTNTTSGAKIPISGVVIMPKYDMNMLSLLRQVGAKFDAWPMRSRLRFLTQLAGALAHSHKNGVIHHDLKCENIGVRALSPEIGDVAPAYSPVLLDFDLAQSSDDLKHVRSGSPHYAAPEVVSSESSDVLFDIDDSAASLLDRVDVWSFGVVAYATLAGSLPKGMLRPNHVQAKMYDNVTKRQASVRRPVPKRTSMLELPSDVRARWVGILSRDSDDLNATGVCTALSALLSACCRYDERVRPNAATVASFLEWIDRYYFENTLEVMPFEEALQQLEPLSMRDEPKSASAGLSLDPVRMSKRSHSEESRRSGLRKQHLGHRLDAFSEVRSPKP
ncbi:MAG: hypothetical protein MHM6MM_002060 [Cercozoa sp. M6MM]